MIIPKQVEITLNGELIQLEYIQEEVIRPSLLHEEKLHGAQMRYLVSTIRYKGDIENICLVGTSHAGNLQWYPVRSSVGGGKEFFISPDNKWYCVRISRNLTESEWAYGCEQGYTIDQVGEAILAGETGHVLVVGKGTTRHVIQDQMGMIPIKLVGGPKSSKNDREQSMLCMDLGFDVPDTDTDDSSEEDQDFGYLVQEMKVEHVPPSRQQVSTAPARDPLFKIPRKWLVAAKPTGGGKDYL